MHPLLASTPVADEVLVTRVHENVHAFVESVSHTRGQVLHPVTKHESVHDLVALSPGPALNTESLHDLRSLEELFSVAEIVAQRGMFARDSDIVHVECWGNRVSKYGSCRELALLTTAA